MISTFHTDIQCRCDSDNPQRGVNVSICGINWFAIILYFSQSLKFLALCIAISRPTYSKPIIETAVIIEGWIPSPLVMVKISEYRVDMVLCHHWQECQHQHQRKYCLFHSYCFLRVNGCVIFRFAKVQRIFQSCKFLTFCPISGHRVTRERLRCGPYAVSVCLRFFSNVSPTLLLHFSNVCRGEVWEKCWVCVR